MAVEATIQATQRERSDLLSEKMRGADRSLWSNASSYFLDCRDNLKSIRKKTRVERLDGKTELSTSFTIWN